MTDCGKEREKENGKKVRLGRAREGPPLRGNEEGGRTKETIHSPHWHPRRSISCWPGLEREGREEHDTRNYVRSPRCDPSSTEDLGSAIRLTHDGSGIGGVLGCADSHAEHVVGHEGLRKGERIRESQFGSNASLLCRSSLGQIEDDSPSIPRRRHQHPRHSR
jgi:hypothetical protein